MQTDLKSKYEIKNRSGKLESEQIEINLLLEAIYTKYGYDFRNCAKPALIKHLSYLLSLTGLGNYSEMTHMLLYDQTFFETLILDFPSM
jgi:chemotaxis protein methyltransferase CheR